MNQNYGHQTHAGVIPAQWTHVLDENRRLLKLVEELSAEVERLSLCRGSIAELLTIIDGKWGKGWHKRNQDVYAKLQLQCRAVLECGEVR